MPSAPNTNGRPFPPEAYVFQEEVAREEIERLRDKIGIDFSSADWVTIDGYGQVLHA